MCVSPRELREERATRGQRKGMETRNPEKATWPSPPRERAALRALLVKAAGRKIRRFFTSQFLPLNRGVKSFVSRTWPFPPPADGTANHCNRPPKRWFTVQAHGDSGRNGDGGTGTSLLTPQCSTPLWSSASSVVDSPARRRTPRSYP